MILPCSRSSRDTHEIKLISNLEPIRLGLFPRVKSHRSHSISRRTSALGWMKWSWQEGRRLHPSTTNLLRLLPHPWISCSQDKSPRYLSPLGVDCRRTASFSTPKREWVTGEVYEWPQIRQMEWLREWRWRRAQPLLSPTVENVWGAF